MRQPLLLMQPLQSQLPCHTSSEKSSRSCSRYGLAMTVDIDGKPVCNIVKLISDCSAFTSAVFCL